MSVNRGSLQIPLTVDTPTQQASTSPNSAATKQAPHNPPSTPLRRIANNLATSIDSLANDDETLPTDLRHHLAALNQLDPDEQAAIRTLIEATLLRHQARKLAG